MGRCAVASFGMGGLELALPRCCIADQTAGSPSVQLLVMAASLERGGEDKGTCFQTMIFEASGRHLDVCRPQAVTVTLVLVQALAPSGAGALVTSTGRSTSGPLATRAKGC